MRLGKLLATLLMLWAVCPAAAQTSSSDQAMAKYIAAQAAALERNFLPGIKTASDLQKAQPALRQTFLDMMGLWPLPEKTPLKATITGRLQRPGYSVENLHFQSSPHLYVTGNLYLPNPLPKEKLPTILYLCGHYTNMGQNGNKTHPDCQSHAIWFATHGYVVLVLDTLELGEIAGLHRGQLGRGKTPPADLRWWWYSAGYTSAGVELWNSIRGLDYLVSRPEVDADRLGVTGISGGGIGTFWLAAADERVKAAAPVSGMSDLQFYAGELGTSVHCDCFFFPNFARWNWFNICVLICPRPMLFVNSDRDMYFPMSGNERLANRLARLYAIAGAGDNLQSVVSVGGHGYRTDVRRAEFQFFNRILKGDGRRVEDGDAYEVGKGAPPIPPSELRAFSKDSDLPKDEINTKIDQSFVPRAKVALPSEKSFETWRTDLLARLRKMCFSAWPTKAPDVAVTKLGDQAAEGRETTEEGIEVFWRWMPGKDKDGMPWLIVLNPGEDSAKLPDWARERVGTSSALVLCPRGVGPLTWARDFPRAIDRSLPLVGSTADSGRVWDVMTVARRHAQGETRWRAAGQGQAGEVALYAALFEPAIAEVVAVDPPPSHQPRMLKDPYGPPLLNVLRVLDVPEAMGCLAPRKLTLVNTRDAAFDKTAEIYHLAGAAERLQRP